MGEQAIINRLLSAMLWSRNVADDVRAQLPTAAFGGRAALVALIDDHDLVHGEVAAVGGERLLSIVQAITEHAVARAQEKHDELTWRMGGQHGQPPASRYTDAAHAMDARAHGRPDPQLLALADRVLTYLPSIAVPVDLAQPPTPPQLIAALRTILATAQ